MMKSDLKMKIEHPGCLTTQFSYTTFRRLGRYCGLNRNGTSYEGIMDLVKDYSALEHP